MKIHYQTAGPLTPEEFIDLLHRSTLAERRPVNEPAVIEAMLRGASVIVTARLESSETPGKLVGVSRAISDGAYCTYLSDLAVDVEFQRQGIGRELIWRTHQAAGSGTTLILLAAPHASRYYQHIGMEPHPSCWIQKAAPARPQQPTTEMQASKLPAAEPSSLKDPGDPGQAAGVEQFFDCLSSEYAGAIQRCVPRYAEMLWALFEYLPPAVTRPRRILELGCGTGNLSVVIAEQFPDAELTLVDLSQASLATCQQRLPSHTTARFVHADMRCLELAESNFDLIMSTIAIHHLTSQEKQALFHLCGKWLVPGGVFTYSDQFAGQSESTYLRHMANWRRFAKEMGASEQEWEMWMQHQREHDFHDSLPDQLDWLENAGFVAIDCTWRYLLWTVLQARKPDRADSSNERIRFFSVDEITDHRLLDSGTWKLE